MHTYDNYIPTVYCLTAYFPLWVLCLNMRCAMVGAQCKEDDGKGVKAPRLAPPAKQPPAAALALRLCIM